MRSILFLLLLSSTLSYSQVIDRYNFVQRPTETGVTIAWRTSSLSTGTIEWGTDAFNLNNTLTEPEQLKNIILTFLDLLQIQNTTIKHLQMADLLPH